METKIIILYNSWVKKIILKYVLSFFDKEDGYDLNKIK